MTHVNSSRPLSGPWRPLTETELAKVPCQLGTYQLSAGSDRPAEHTDGDAAVTHIGYAGAREPFGMRSALARHITDERAAASGAPATDPPATVPPAQFRCEFTANYASRYDELLMQHIAAHGQLPDHQRHEEARVGRLSPPT